jgi:hypothetical protein
MSIQAVTNVYEHMVLPHFWVHMSYNVSLVGQNISLLVSGSLPLP